MAEDLLKLATEYAQLQSERDEARKVYTIAEERLSAVRDKMAGIIGFNLTPPAVVKKTTSRTSHTGPSAAEIRQWAASQKPPLKVTPRGRISGEVLDKFEKAHSA